MRIDNKTTFLDFIRSTGLLFWSVYFVIPYREYSSNPLLFFFLLIGLLCLWIWALGYKAIDETKLINKNILRMDWKTALFFTGVLIILLVLNFKFLNGPIAWRGDEDFHIYRAFFFLQFIKTKAMALKFLFILLPVFYVAIFLLRFYGKIRISLISSISIPLVIFAIIWSLFLWGDNYRNAFLRYPPLLMVFQSFLVGPWPHSEIAHRMIAFIPFTGIFFLLFKYLEPNIGRFNAALSSLVFATIPLFFYFSTVTFLEQGALLFEALALFLLINANILYTLFLRVIGGIAGFSGFCKETMIPFLMGFFIVMIIIEHRFSGKKFGQSLPNILRLGILIFAPISPFLLQNLSPNIDPHRVEWLKLIDFKIYSLFFSGVLSQITVPILLICFLGIIGGVFIEKGKYAVLTAILTSLLSFIGVSILTAPWVGYARYNLALFSFFFIGFLSFFRFEFTKKYSNKIIFSLLLITLLVASFNFAPVTFSKRNNWGSPGIDTAEYYYPYNKALKWISEKNSQYKIFISGHKYPYFAEFYRYKYKIVNEIMQDAKETIPVFAFKKAIEVKADILILHNNPQTHISLPDEIKQYLTKSFELGGNFLDVIRVPINKEDFI